MERQTTSASWRRAWGLLALLPLASLSYCTPDPSAVVNRNIRFRAVIAGYPDSPTKKVSGTNESFSVSVTASSDMYEESDPHWDQAWVSYVKISIGGQTVQEWTWASPENQALIKNYSVRWATTQFDHGATPEVKVEAKCKVQVTGGSVTEFSATDATVDVDVYNYGFACELEELSPWPVASTVGSLLETMNHHKEVLLGIDGTMWGPVWVGMVPATVFFFHGHGGCGPLPDSTSHFGPKSEWVIDSNQVRVRRQDAMELGFPTVNFAFLAACKTGLNNQMAEGFLFPYRSANSSAGVVNQAEMGWRGTDTWNAYPTWHEKFSADFFQYMLAGLTANESRAYAFVDLQAYLAMHSELDQLPNPSWPVTDYITLWGDKQTRLNGLYNGLDGPAPVDWYEVQAGA